MTVNKLPADFPNQITVAFQEGHYKGERQYWAPFEHKGSHYKLVMTGGASPRPGDVGTVYVDHSPNGHIVFCTLYKPSDNEDYQDDDFDYDAHRERQEELYWERMEREH